MVKLFYYGFSKELLGYCATSSNKKKLKSLSNELKTMASNRKLASMAALQIGQTIQYFVMLNNRFLKEGQWNSYSKMKQSNYKGILNAQIKDYSQQKQKLWQQCSSYPGIKMLIQRPRSIKVEYMDQNLKDYKQQLHDFTARIFQHQIDHYFGQDYLKKTLQIEISNEQMRQKHQQQCNMLLTNYRKSLQIDKKDKQKEKDNNSNQPKNSIHFNKLRQFLTYSIIDKLRQQ